MAERLVIERIGHRGDGIAKGPTEPVYIPFALPGEIVEADPVPGNPDRRRLIQVAQPSAERIAPICRHFGICGGCAVQHWSAEPYRAWKRDLVVTALSQAAIAAPVDTLIDAHGDGRRRAVFHARLRGHDVLDVGFSAARAHRIIPIDRCPILAPTLDGAIETAWAIAEAMMPARKPLDIQVTATDTGLDVDLRGSGPLTAALTATVARVAAARRLARLTRHGELVAQRVVPMLRVGPASVPLPPAAFLQATAEGEATIARLVAGHCAGAKTIADLFCGIGPFALRLSAQARITAADDDAAAIAALQRAAGTTQGLKPIDAQARDLFRRPFMAKELERFDAVLFDPPRQGAEAQARELASSKVPVVVAVSCNAATFARDARHLIDGGYRLTAVSPVDQFRYSAHVEIVARFAR